MDLSLDPEVIKEAENLLHSPPEGAWVRSEWGQLIVGVSTRSKDSIGLIFFTLLFSGFSFFGFFMVTTSAGNLFSLFMVPFILASMWLLKKSLYSLFGKVEIVFTENGDAHVFIGTGKTGKKHDIYLKSVKKIFRKKYHDVEGHLKKEITIEEEKTIVLKLEFINEEKSNFLLLVLLYHRFMAIKNRKPNYNLSG